jgi:cytochrome c oxidase subunit 4
MENNDHIFEYKTLFFVLLALLGLTCVTLGASYIDLGRFNVWVALGIASIKASLVLMVFMHLKFEGRLVIFSFLSTIFFLAIMIGFTFWDVGFR